MFYLLAATREMVCVPASMGRQYKLFTISLSIDCLVRIFQNILRIKLLANL